MVELIKGTWKDSLQFWLGILVTLVLIALFGSIALNFTGTALQQYPDISGIVTPALFLVIVGYLLHHYRTKIDDTNDRLRILEGKFEALEHLGEIKRFADKYAAEEK